MVLSLLLALLVVLAAGLPVAAQAPSAADDGRVPGIEFLNERLRIPESSSFDEGAYIESGVGLRFGVEKRLTYYPGDYEEAAQNFEEAVRLFPLKAEIWVFLARAYFYMKSPAQARGTLVRAEAAMPDLSEKLWQPLIASLEWEIRKRARQQQTQIDFYSAGQDEFLSLFRLYLFLADHDDAAALIGETYKRASSMRERAQMVSGNSRHAYMAESQRWTQLGERLAGELTAVGGEAPAPPPAAAPPAADTVDVEARERIRVLQLRVDYYDAKIDEYLELFQAYVAQNDSTHAQGVIAALGRLVGSLKVQASVAATASEQAQLEDDAAEYQRVRDDLQSQLEGVATGAAP